LAADQLQISELFFSIQGESSFAGYPCVFIRLSGCNLRCVYCDASYTYEEAGRPMPVSEILEFTANYPSAIVEITGGEPLLQQETFPLMTALVKAGRKVLLETNGSLDLGNVPAEVVKIVDLKCPDSGMEQQMRLENLPKLTADDELKCVISSKQDYEWAVKILREYNLLQPLTSKNFGKKCQILFSTVADKLSPTDLSKWIIKDQLPVRLQLQLHKILWPETARGV